MDDCMEDIELLGKYLSTIHRYSRAHIDKRLHHLGIGGAQFGLMMALQEKEGINQIMLSENLRLDKTTITRSIRPLVENGYVVRERDPNDRRGYRIHLTDKGRSVRQELFQMKLDLESRLMQGFSKAEKRQLMTLLRRMTENSGKLD